MVVVVRDLLAEALDDLHFGRRAALAVICRVEPLASETDFQAVITKHLVAGNVDDGVAVVTLHEDQAEHGFEDHCRFRSDFRVD